MNSVFGSGGRMNALVSSSAAAGSENSRNFAEVDPRFLDGQAADEMPRERVRLEVPQDGAGLIDERHADRVLGRRDLDQPLPALVAGGEGLGEQVPEEEHLDAALAHLRDELVVLVLGALDPEDVVEEQLVVVRRREPLEAELRTVHHHLAQLADLRIRPERLHHSSVPIP